VERALNKEAVFIWLLSLLVVGALLLGKTPAFGQQEKPDPLPSWNAGAAKTAILDFVRAATDPKGPQRVPQEQRIATFDQDGTLWVEHPAYTQVMFAFDRIKALALHHPDWKTQHPFRAILTEDVEAIRKFSLQDFERIVAETHSGMTVEEFSSITRQWLSTARHPRFHRPYTELVYQPMLELMSYLRSHGFQTYIVTGGGQEFVRVFSEELYGVPPEHVMGSAAKTKLVYDKDGKPMLVKRPEVFLIDDHAGKVEGIHFAIGRRPIAAFGNSVGDQQMLEWTQAGPGPRLMMLVHHDDPQREYAYGPHTHVGTFSDALMAKARRDGWTIVSMKQDWKRVFKFDPSPGPSRLP
jgi:hypothetical protein